jgi:hypothetical protein
MDIVRRIWNRLGFGESVEYTIGTWNIGRFSDFLKCLIGGKYKDDDIEEERKNLKLPIDFKGLSSADEESIENWRKWRLKLLRQALNVANLDLLMLQEVSKDDVSELCRSLEKPDKTIYGCVHDGEDTLVLYRLEKFREKKSNPSIKTRNSVWVTLEESDPGDRTPKTICLASTHLTGFSLAYDDTEERKTGNEQLLELCRELENSSDVRDCDAVILGMDANSTPSIHPSRLEIPIKFGFTRADGIDTIAGGTAFNPDLGRAHLDHIFWQVRRGEGKFTLDENIPEEIPPPSDHKLISGKFSFS